MKKIILTILCSVICLFAGKPNYGDFLVKSSMLISATDMTNINKSDYNVYLDLNDTIATNIIANQNTNLCDGKIFKKHMGEFNCKKEIKYKISEKNNADIIITDKEISTSGKRLVVCTGEFNGCDVIIGGKKFIVNKEQIESKGFIMDPNLKFKK